MNQLEIEKTIEAHKLEMARMNLNANKTTPSEWASIIKETVPSMVDSFKEVIQVYNSVKDIEIKKVN